MKKIGIWLDKAKAYLITLDGGEEKLETLISEVEDFNPSGGSRSKTKWGPQDVVQDSKYTEREKHQLKRYFDSLADALKEADEIAIFGPASTYQKLDQYLREHYKALGAKIKGVEKADSMTENQVKALVRNYFE